MALVAIGSEWTKSGMSSLNIVGLSNGTSVALWVVMEEVKDAKSGGSSWMRMALQSAARSFSHPSAPDP